MLNTIVSIFLAVFLIAVSWLLGAALLRPRKFFFETVGERSVFCISIGLVFIGFFTYAVGLAGQLYPQTIWLFLLAGSGIGLYLTFRDSLDTDLPHRSSLFPKQEWGMATKALSIVIMLSGFLNLIGALAPETGFDALWYHISIPEIYVNTHRVAFLPQINLSGYPRLMEMIYTLAFTIGGETLAKLMHFSTGLLISITLYFAGRSLGNTATGMIAAAVFYCMQPVNMLSATANIDLGLALMVLAGFLALLYAIKTDQLRWLVISGVFAGAAMGMKYQGVIVLVALALTWWICAIKRDRLWPGLALIILTAILVFLPWMVDNRWSTGNPVYPLFNKYFGLAESWEQVDIGSHRQGGWFSGHGLTGLLTLPWKLSMGKADGWLSPLFLLCLPLLMIFRPRGYHVKPLAVFSLIYYIGLFALPYWIVRFFIPLTPALALLCAMLWQQLPDRDRWLRGTLKVSVSVVLLTNLGFLALKNGPLLPAVLGVESPQTYLEATLGWTSVNAFLDTKMKVDEKALVYGAQLFYRFDFPYVYDMPAPSGSAEMKARELRRRGIKFIVVLIDRTGPQSLSQVKGWQHAETSGYFPEVFERKMPEPTRSNAARGVVVYKVDS